MICTQSAGNTHRDRTTVTIAARFWARLRRSVILPIAFGLGLSALTCWAGVAPGDRAFALEQIKADFPKHTAGPITERTHPDVAELFFRLKRQVRDLRVEDFAEHFEDLRGQVMTEIRRSEMSRSHSSDRPSEDKTAEEQNLVWLKTKVKPWLLRLESAGIGG